MKQWVFNEELGFPQCPVCKRWIHVYQGDATMNYCPNCGELLDGEEFKKHTRHGEVIIPSPHNMGVRITSNGVAGEVQADCGDVKVRPIVEW